MEEFVTEATEAVEVIATTAAQADPELFFEPANFIDNLSHMGVGMLVIFAVIGVIILTTTMINKIFSK